MITVRVHMEDVDRGLAAIAARPREMASVFRALKPPARSDQGDHQAREEGPNGPWPKRSPATIARAGERNRRTLTSKTTTRRRKNGGMGARIRTYKRSLETLGSLPRSITATASRERLRLTSPPGWSEVHNAGGAAGRGARIPKREFLWFSDPFLDRAAVAIETFIIAPWDQETKAAASGLAMSVRGLAPRGRV